MRRHAAGSVGIGGLDAGCVATAASAPTSADELVHRAFAAIAANDVDALVRLGTFTAPSLACAPPSTPSCR
jgi:hypothetical protein